KNRTGGESASRFTRAKPAGRRMVRFVIPSAPEVTRAPALSAGRLVPPDTRPTVPRVGSQATSLQRNRTDEAQASFNEATIDASFIVTSAITTTSIFRGARRS